MLGHRGEEQACRELLAKLKGIYDRYVSDLRKAGVDPAEIESCRQDRLARTKPMEQLDRGFTLGVRSSRFDVRVECRVNFARSDLANAMSPAGVVKRVPPDTRRPAGKPQGRA